MITLYDHPLSPYAQKVRIALREKGAPFQVALPGGLGAGGAAGEFAQANPRAEVPVLIDGDAKVFDSTIILEYLEDAFPSPAMLPASPGERARVRDGLKLSPLRVSVSQPRSHRPECRAAE